MPDNGRCMSAAARITVVSRRAALVALLSAGATACSKVAFLAVNVPDAAARGPRPLVVFWYGGRWEEGDKSNYRFVGDALAALGCVVVLPNYRHYPNVKLAGFMQDAAEAAAWAVKHAP